MSARSSHAIFNGEPSLCNKTFLSLFKKIQVSNFNSMCDHCLTAHENKEASNYQQQISSLGATVNALVNEFINFKCDTKKEPCVAAAPSLVVQNPVSQPNKETTWSDKVKQPNSLCIKSNGTAIDLEKINKITSENSIQVTKKLLKKR